MSDQSRPVWLTADEIDLPHHELYALLEARYIAAPADAAGAVVTALEGCGIFSLKRREAVAVLRALGKA